MMLALDTGARNMLDNIAVLKFKFDRQAATRLQQQKT